MLGSILLLGAVAAPALAHVEARATPAPVLAKRVDRIECSVQRYKLETAAEQDGDPTPTMPAEVLDLAEATPTLFLEYGSYLNVTDACEAPAEITGDAAEALSTYMSEAEAWSSRHACELKSIYDDCQAVDAYSSSYLAPSVFCTSVVEAAEAEETCSSPAARAQVGIAASLVAAIVAGAAAIAL